MTDSPQLKLRRTLPVTVGDTTKTLPVVRVVATQTMRYPDVQSVPSKPLAILGSEKVEIVFRAGLTDFYDELMGATAANAIPYGTIHFGHGTAGVRTMIRDAEIAAPHGEGTSVLLTFLLLRVPVHTTEFDDDWEKDEEHSYSRDGVYVTAMKPKPRIEVHVGDPNADGGWQYVGTSTGGVTWEGQRPTHNPDRAVSDSNM